jgi:tRNA threonylcarbamoyl adenosine modification protein YeaZ
VFVLVIDTSSPAVIAAVATLEPEPTVLAQRAPVAARGHGELLAPSIEGCLDDVGIAAHALGAVVAGTGPGPYTGLRVGLMTAAAFADAIGVPTYSVCSLDAVLPPTGGAAVVLTDARRQEVYWARYDALGARVDGPHVARPDDVVLEGVPAIAGAAVELYAPRWPGDIARRPERFPQPGRLVRLAADRIAARAPSEGLTPRYLRRPDAVAPGAPKPVSQ